MAAWVAAPFVRAADLIRHTYDGWDRKDQEQFSGMLAKAFLPLIIEGGVRPGYRGNVELSMSESLLSIGVYEGDTAVFNKGLALFRRRVPAYFYLTADGDLPLAAFDDPRYATEAEMLDYWHDPKVLTDGHCQETCRDQKHVQMGLAALLQAAEIAWQQGVDLYAEFAERVLKGMEFHADILLGNVPDNICERSLREIDRFYPAWEIGYNHYHNRMKNDLPRTRALIMKIRPEDADLDGMWGTLTHAELPVFTVSAGRENDKAAINSRSQWTLKFKSKSNSIMFVPAGMKACAADCLFLVNGSAVRLLGKVKLSILSQKRDD
jgi:hypothetical protein